MKSTLFFIVLICLLLTLPKCQHTTTIDNTPVASGFTKDSGYIYDYDLLQKIKFDTIDSLFSYINIDKNDTVGKYYKANNGHYFSCLNASHCYEGYLLVETLLDGTIIAEEPFGVGIHSCCWDKRYDGFKKYGNYISFRSCTTGSAVCGGSISLFKSLKPQGEMRDISESIWTATDGLENYRDVTSNMVIKHDTVIMHYTAVDYTEIRNKKKVNKTEKFTVRYVDNNSSWIALDSTRFNINQ